MLQAVRPAVETTLQGVLSCSGKHVHNEGGPAANLKQTFSDHQFTTLASDQIQVRSQSTYR